MLEPEKLKKAIQSFKSSPFFIPLTLLVIGVLLLILFVSPTGDKTSKKSASLSTEEYIQTLEMKLEKNINRITSVEDCSVMLTISSVEDNEYLENKSISSSLDEKSEEYSRQEEYLVIENGGDDSVVIKSRKMPKICGALVVYEGSADIHTKKNILDAVSTVLGIQSNKVFVVSNQE